MIFCTTAICMICIFAVLVIRVYDHVTGHYLIRTFIFLVYPHIL